MADAPMSSTERSRTHRERLRRSHVEQRCACGNELATRPYGDGPPRSLGACATCLAAERKRWTTLTAAAETAARARALAAHDSLTIAELLDRALRAYEGHAGDRTADPLHSVSSSCIVDT